MKAVGLNTADSTKAVARIGPETSRMACLVAARGLSPRAMLRSTFSTTTIASSTTMPMANTNPKSDNALMVKPKLSMIANVPMIDTGTAGCNFAYSGTDCGYNVQTKSGGIVYSEMASLYYDTLGNKGAYNTSGASQSGTLVNKGDFLNMQSFAYWSGLEYVPDPSNAWLFSPYGGDQNRIGKTSSLYALAVRPGDVVAAVPEPATYAMMLLGLSALVVAVRRRPR